LDANKQIVYHIFKDILEGSNVEAIDKYLSARYIQHNPNIPSGHDGLKKMLSMVKPKPVSEKLSAHVVSVWPKAILSLSARPATTRSQESR